MSEEKEEKLEFDSMQGLMSYFQKNLKVPKNQYNKYGDFFYRDAEEILECAKAIMPEGCTIELEDEPVVIVDRFYVKSTATVSYKQWSHSRTAYAREPLTKKGMDESMITGATSSYARKSALGGLFAIDDTADSDKTSKEKPGVDKKDPNFSMAPGTQEEKAEMEDNAYRTAIKMIETAETVDALSKLWSANSKHWVKLPRYDDIERIKNERKKKLMAKEAA